MLGKTSKSTHYLYMDKIENKYYSVSFKLYTIKDGGEKEFQDEASENDPFTLISGLSTTTIPGFDKEIMKYGNGDEFEFTVPCADAYGDYNPEMVIQLDKPEGNEAQVQVGAIVPLQNDNGQRFMGHITAIEGNKVTIDLNHPLAGSDLFITGKVLDCHEATNEEIQQMINMLSGGCHGGCGGCGGGSCGGNCGSDCGGDCGGDCNCGK